MITNILIFFAIPLAVVIISIALQKVLKNPFLVAGIIFSILLVIVLALFDPIYLIAVLAYSILSFITAILTALICRYLKNQICNVICNSCGENNTETIEISNGDTTYNQNNFQGVTGSYARNYRNCIR